MPGKQPTIQNFIASMNRAKGFARTSKYAVIITPPTAIQEVSERSNQQILRDGAPATVADAKNLINMQLLNKAVGPQVNLHCNSVSLPGHDLQAQDMQHGSAPGRQMVTSHDYQGTIAATFYLDVNLKERHFFEQWQKLAVDNSTHKANYYDDYIGSMQIFQLDGNGEITYGIKATEVYPTTIAGIEYAYANTNQIALQSVNFQYRQWFNMTADSIAGYNEVGRFTESIKNYGPPFFEESGTSLFSNAKSEQKRQEQLRPPEIDRQTFSARNSLTENKRQEQLRPPEVDRRDEGRKGRLRQAKRREQLRSPTSKASTRRGR